MFGGMLLQIYNFSSLDINCIERATSYVITVSLNGFLGFRGRFEREEGRIKNFG